MLFNTLFYNYRAFVCTGSVASISKISKGRLNFREWLPSFFCRAIKDNYLGERERLSKKNLYKYRGNLHY
jgi:hypothetical protein